MMNALYREWTAVCDEEGEDLEVGGSILGRAVRSFVRHKAQKVIHTKLYPVETTTENNP